jgi:hypothetical protein
MPNGEREMPTHIGAAYRDAIDNIIFLKRQEWIATNYALLIYVAIFVSVAEYFSKTDFARNVMGILAIATFLVHWYVMILFQQAIERFRTRLYWIYRTYFTSDERANLDLPAGPLSAIAQWEGAGWLVVVSLVGCVLTAVYVWSVR